MTTRRFKVLLTWDPESEVWVTYVPSLDGMSTFGKTRAEALANTTEAITGYLEAAAKEGKPLPSDDADAEVVDVEVAVA